MTNWGRECREVDDGLSEVERESKDLKDIADDPSKATMHRAKVKVRGVMYIYIYWMINVFLQF